MKHIIMAKDCIFLEEIDGESFYSLSDDRDAVFIRVIDIIPNTVGKILPDNKFCLVRLEKDGEIVIIPKEDRTERCLFFVDSDMNKITIDSKWGPSVCMNTNGKIIDASKHEKVISRNDHVYNITAIIILDKGQEVDFDYCETVHYFEFRPYRTSESYSKVVYTWDGDSIITETFSNNDIKSINKRKLELERRKDFSELSENIKNGNYQEL